MKIMRYILIILGILFGMFFAVMEGAESYLDENLCSALFIPYRVFLIKLLIIYIFIGAISGWSVCFCVYRISILIKYLTRNK